MCLYLGRTKSPSRAPHTAVARAMSLPMKCRFDRRMFLSLALARRLRASLGPQALCIYHCSWGPTPTPTRSAALRLALAAGALHLSLLVVPPPPPHSLPLGGLPPR